MKLRDILREIGEATSSPYPLDLTVRTEGLDKYEFATDSGNEYSVFIEKDTDGGQTDYDVAFSVMERGRVMFPGHRPGKSINFEKEVNDPKNIFRVMATVLEAIKRSMQRDEKSGETRVARIIMNPTKRDKSDTRRTALYKKYIEKQMPPGTKVYTEPDGSRIQVELP